MIEMSVNEDLSYLKRRIEVHVKESDMFRHMPSEELLHELSFSNKKLSSLKTAAEEAYEGYADPLAKAGWVFGASYWRDRVQRIERELSLRSSGYRNEAGI